MAHLIEFDEYLTPDSARTKYNLHDADVLFLMSDAGRGMPPIEYITERGPLQHGETLIDYRLRPRVISMVIRQKFMCRDEYWEGRNNLLDIIRPNRQDIGAMNPGTLRKILPDGAMRDIDVIVESGPAFEPRDVSRWDELAFTEVLRFIAHDPTFYDPNLEAAEWVLTTDSNLIFYEAPGYIHRAVFPIWFGASLIASFLNVDYLGTWPAYPDIIVTGPGSNPIIRNDTTGEKLELAYDIAAGEVVTFTTQYGNKTVTNQAGDNLLPYLTADSDLATFHLEPAPGAPGGVNQLFAFVAAPGPATEVAVQWHTRWIGI